MHACGVQARCTRPATTNGRGSIKSKPNAAAMPCAALTLLISPPRTPHTQLRQGAAARRPAQHVNTQRVCPIYALGWVEQDGACQLAWPLAMRRTHAAWLWWSGPCSPHRSSTRNWLPLVQATKPCRAWRQATPRQRVGWPLTSDASARRPVHENTRKPALAAHRPQRALQRHDTVPTLRHVVKMRAGCLMLCIATHTHTQTTCCGLGHGLPLQDNDKRKKAEEKSPAWIAPGGMHQATWSSGPAAAGSKPLCTGSVTKDAGPYGSAWQPTCQSARQRRKCSGRTIGRRVKTDACNCCPLLLGPVHAHAHAHSHTQNHATRTARAAPQHRAAYRATSRARRRPPGRLRWRRHAAALPAAGVAGRPAPLPARPLRGPAIQKEQIAAAAAQAAVGARHTTEAAAHTPGIGQRGQQQARRQAAGGSCMMVPSIAVVLLWRLRTWSMHMCLLRPNTQHHALQRSWRFVLRHRSGLNTAHAQVVPSVPHAHKNVIWQCARQ